MAEKGAPDDVPEPLFCGLNGGYYTHVRADSPHPSPRPARRRRTGVQRDKSLWRCPRRTARRAGETQGAAPSYIQEAPHGQRGTANADNHADP